MAEQPDPAEETALSNRCLLYLYGELGAEENRKFEAELATSRVLGDELARQACTISLLSDCWPLAPAAPASTRAASQAAGPRPLAKSHTRRRRTYLAVALTIAASGLIAVVVPRALDSFRSPPTEELRIARTWANTHAHWASDATAGQGESVGSAGVDDTGDAAFTEASLADSLGPAAGLDTAGPFSDELVPSWMLVAVDASPEAPESSWDKNDDDALRSETL